MSLFLFKNYASLGVLFAVSVFATCRPSQKQSKEKDETTIISAVNASHLDSLEKQEHIISMEETNFLVGKKGVLFVFHPQAFVDESGKPVQGKVQVEFREAQEMKDFVASRLLMAKYFKQQVLIILLLRKMVKYSNPKKEGCLLGFQLCSKIRLCVFLKEIKPIKEM